jgi:hypothetical protein
MTSLFPVRIPAFTSAVLTEFSYCYAVSLVHAVAQFVEALHYNPKGREFDSRWCHWIFFIDIILPAALWRWR